MNESISKGMETKHTSGPWEYSQEDQQVHLPGDHSKLIADIRGWGWLQKLENGADIQDKNGKLIAASPDMLEALMEIKSMLDNHEEDFSNTNAYLSLELAIKKATK